MTPVPQSPTVSPRALAACLAADGFLPATRLARLIDDEHVAVVDRVLHCRGGGRYVLQDAVRILGRSDPPDPETSSDPFGFTGMVEPLATLVRRGFVISTQRVALGRRVYDVEHGVICHPMASADDSGVNIALNDTR